MVGVPLGQITLYGANFDATAQVLVDGTAISQPSVMSSAQIQFQISSTNTDFTPQTYHIQVQQKSGSSNVETFTVYSPTVGPQPFNSVQGFDPGGANSNQFALADVNGDGLADVVMPGPAGSQSLSIMLGQANGQLGAPTVTPNLIAGLMVAGDVNGDGFVDIVSATSVTGSPLISVLLNDGKGNFRQGPTLPFTGVFPECLTLQDMDGDGKPDLLFSVIDTQSLYFVKNLGNGSFAPPVLIASPTGALSAFVVGDFTGDGKPDIAYALADPTSGQSMLHLLVNQGGDAFKDQAVPTVTSQVGSLIAGDFNHDGHLDLAIQPEPRFVTVPQAELDVFFGQGNGTFSTGPVTLIEYSPFESYTLVAGDFDGDGNLDLAGVNSETEPGRAVMLWGDGAGNFTPQFVNGPMGFGILAAGDVNGDGVADVVVPDRFGILSVLIGQKTRSFPSILPLYPNGWGPASAADINHDGKVDLFLAPNTTYLNQGGNSFVLAGSPTGPGITVADINNDGLPDLIGSDGTNILIWKGTGDPNFSGAPVSIPIPNVPGSSSQQLIVADIDGDGLPDIVLANQILFNQGNLTFLAVPVNFGSVDSPFAIGDVNGDGLPDIITGGFTVINKGNRNFTLVPYNNLNITNNEHIAVGDFNQDGKADVVFGGDGDPIVVLYGRGDGTFYEQSALNVGPVSDYSQALGVADLNGDGRPDIVACLSLSEQCVVFTNDGQGGFQRSYFASGTTTVSLLLTDLNGGGNPDLALGNYMTDFNPPNANVIFHK
jgi:hypothetical protein